jgi:hypothetical protein
MNLYTLFKENQDLAGYSISTGKDHDLSQYFSEEELLDCPEDYIILEEEIYIGPLAGGTFAIVINKDGQIIKSKIISIS